MRRATATATVCLVILGFFSSQQGGAGQVRIKYGSREEEKRARLALELATRLAVVLPKVLHDFQARRRELLAAGGGAAYPQDGLAALLDSTESRLRKELKKSELAPLRDHVAEIFQETRGGLGPAAKAARAPSPRPQAVLASLRPVLGVLAAAGERVDRGVADPVLDALLAFLQGIYERATRKDLTVDLCVVSDPPGAKVSLRVKDGEYGEAKRTVGRIEYLFLGRYFCTVEGKGFDIRAEDCPLDLSTKRQPVLDCRQSEQDCELRDGWPQVCRER